MRKIGLFIGPCQYSPITTIVHNINRKIETSRIQVAHSNLLQMNLSYYLYLEGLDKGPVVLTFHFLVDSKGMQVVLLPYQEVPLQG